MNYNKREGRRGPAEQNPEVRMDETTSDGCRPQTPAAAEGRSKRSKLSLNHQLDSTCSHNEDVQHATGLSDRLTRDELLERVRLNTGRQGRFQLPNANRGLLQEHLWGERVRKSWFEVMDMIEVDGLHFHNVTVPVSDLGCGPIMCHELRMCHAYTEYQALVFDYCPRHRLALPLERVPETRITETDSNVLRALFVTGAYKQIGSSHLTPLPRCDPSDFIVSVLAFGDCGMHEEGLKIQVFPSPLEALPLYSHLCEAIKAVHRPCTVVLEPAILGLILQGTKTNTELSFALAEAFLVSPGDGIRRIGLCLYEDIGTTLAYLSYHGLLPHSQSNWTPVTCPVDMLLNNPAMFAKLDHRPPTIWAELVSRVAAKWYVTGTNHSLIRCGEGFTGFEANHIMNHAAVMASCDAWEAIQTRPTQYFNYEKACNLHLSNLLRGGGKPPAKPATDKKRWRIKKSAAITVFDGLSFPDKGLITECPSYLNRCGAYTVYQILKTKFQDFKLPCSAKSTSDELDKVWCIMQQACLFAGFEPEEDMWRPDLLLAVLLLFGIKATIYKVQSHDDKSYFWPIITSNNVKLLDRGKTQMVHILHTGDFASGHYQPMTEAAHRFCRQMSTVPDVVKFEPISMMRNPSCVGYIMKEFNPIKKRLIKSKIPQLPASVNFTSEFVATALTHFTPCDIAYAFSCANYKDKITRLLPRDIFIGTDQHYPQQWTEEDKQLRNNLKNIAAKIDPPLGPFRTKLQEFIEDSPTTVHVTCGVSLTTTQKIDAFLQSRSAAPTPKVTPMPVEVVPPPTPVVPVSPLVAKPVSPPATPPPPIPPKPDFFASHRSKPIPLAPTPKNIQSTMIRDLTSSLPAPSTGVILPPTWKTDLFSSESGITFGYKIDPFADIRPSGSLFPDIPDAPVVSTLESLDSEVPWHTTLDIPTRPVPPKIPPKPLVFKMKPIPPPKPSKPVPPPKISHPKPSTIKSLPPPLPPKPKRVFEIDGDDVPDIEELSFLDGKPILPPFCRQEHIAKVNGVIYKVDRVSDQLPLHNFVNDILNRPVDYSVAFSYYDRPVMGDVEASPEEEDTRIISYKNDKNMKSAKYAFTTMHAVTRRGEQRLKRNKERLDRFESILEIDTSLTPANVGRKILQAAFCPITIPGYAAARAVKLLLDYQHESQIIKSYTRTSQKICFVHTAVENLPQIVDYTGNFDKEAMSIIQTRIRTVVPYLNLRTKVAYGAEELNPLEGTYQFAQMYYQGRRLVADTAINSYKGAQNHVLTGQLVNILQ